MLRYFQNKYAMSEKGAQDLLRSIIWTVVLDLSFMAPVVLSFKFLDEYLNALLNPANNPENSILYYVMMSAALFLVMFVIAYFQYDSTYTKIYEESARRRISLAETLRKLPLAFFGKKDIADLSATIMDDSTQIEMLFSHSVPQIYAAALTVFIMGVLLFIYNWMLALAVFWVVPVAILVFVLSRKLQNKMHTELYQMKREISDIIQEGLDSAQEIKSYNREKAFSHRLNAKLDHYEKFMIKGELLIGAFLNLSHVFLQLGCRALAAA